MARSACHQALWVCALLLLGCQAAGEGSSPSCPNDIEKKGERELLATKTEGVDNSSDGRAGVEPEDHAILQANYYKRLHKSDWSLADWQKVSCCRLRPCAILQQTRDVHLSISYIIAPFIAIFFLYLFENRLVVC